MNPPQILLMLAGFMLASPLSFAAGTIKISPDQLKTLGITLGALIPVKKIPLLSAPARAIVPPTQEHIVSAAQSASIVKMAISVGDTVQQGQILAQLNSPDFLTLQSRYLKANSELQLSLAGFKRDETLFEEGIISKRRWRETRAEYRLHITEADQAKQLLRLAGMSETDINDLTKHRRLQSFFHVRSPINGVVLQSMVVAGQRVDALAPLFRIANLEQIWLEIDVPQERIKEIDIGDEVIVDDYPFTARVSVLGKSVHPKNLTVLARAVINRKRPAIRVGQTVNIRVIRTPSKITFKTPDSAISRSEGKPYIFIRTDDGFKAQPVNILGKEGKYTFIQSKLDGDERLAIDGTVALKAVWLGLGDDQ